MTETRLPPEFNKADIRISAFLKYIFEWFVLVKKQLRVITNVITNTLSVMEDITSNVIVIDK